ncbi:MAG: DNA mismatch repair protein MutS [Candidatus Gastranaerophilales bacterium]|nr:DNA mismatch repair protein MutS [Candidatus Gastranaerophilales bacterium]
MTKKEINNINSFDVDLSLATPMLRQYLDIKRKYQDIILMYRMGDFYECFFEDALTVSKALEITLTARDGGDLGKIPMAGIPAKAFDNYLPKLLEKGFKAAVCDQMEDPALAKGLVKREVTQVITAGTISELSLVNSDKNNWLAAIINVENVYGLAYTDITTGEFFVTQGGLSEILAELQRIKPSEVLAPVKKQKVLPFQIVPDEKFDLPEQIYLSYNCSKMSSIAFDKALAEKNIKELFETETLSSFGYNEFPEGFRAAGAIVAYLNETRKANLPKFDTIKSYNISEFLSLDINTARNLELLYTNRDKSKYGSLLWAVDKVKTNMGARLLKKWITQPLKDVEKINKRLDAVEELLNNSFASSSLSSVLAKVYDIERLAVKLSNSSANPRDILAIKNSLLLLPEIVEILGNFNSEFLRFNEDIDDLTEFASIVDRTIKEDAPVGVKDGGIINDGVNGELDYYRELLNGGEKKLAETEAKEKERTGIKNLRIGYSKTFGYFIEVTNSNLGLVPQDYIRRQTLTNAERFITEELKTFETEVSAAKFKSVETEYKIFSDLREYAKEFADKIKEIAHRFAVMDVLLSFATVAAENSYVRPIINDSNDMYIKDGRHPVLEKVLPMGKYVPNDLRLRANVTNSTDTQFMILTGPNMAGKSTFMRQNALIVIMAQMGCFVPASYAEIGVADKIFTRVGASDDLSLGQSTFMVEMSETAYILNSATEKSFILLDEIGRGTSTYDGVAIAWSVAEYIATKIKARTVFATHYHELNVMPRKFEQIKNYRITISEKDGEIEFLRKIVEGSASKSYGVQVAKKAGLPECVISNAQKLMVEMQKEFQKDLAGKKRQGVKNPEIPQLTLPFGD